MPPGTDCLNKRTKGPWSTKASALSVRSYQHTTGHMPEVKVTKGPFVIVWSQKKIMLANASTVAKESFSFAVIWQKKHIFFNKIDVPAQ